MENFDRKNHWENIYETKELSTVSWFQPVPQTSLDLIVGSNIPKSAKIIDVGGGDAYLADFLLEMGYQDITVLDISEKAIERAKKRLGEKSAMVKWLVADAANFESDEKFDLWHDRAVFHFFTDKNEIERYSENANSLLVENGKMIVGTFSENGPTKCSGIEIMQHSKASLNQAFEKYFEKKMCFTEDHITPSGGIQNFIFCTFTKKN
jgi:ubiquinone/menaquinone biosynthesis C-methylase UbiE